MGEFGPEAQLVFHSVLDRALAKLGKKEQQLGGVLRIDNTIPVGGGLGASAALCVAVGNLLSLWDGCRSRIDILSLVN